MPSLYRLVEIKTAGPEGKHCDQLCAWNRMDDYCGYDGARLALSDGEYLRSPECLRDAKEGAGDE